MAEAEVQNGLLGLAGALSDDDSDSDRENAPAHNNTGQQAPGGKVQAALAADMQQNGTLQQRSATTAAAAPLAAATNAPRAALPASQQSAGATRPRVLADGRTDEQQRQDVRDQCLTEPTSGLRYRCARHIVPTCCSVLRHTRWQVTEHACRHANVHCAARRCKCGALPTAPCLRLCSHMRSSPACICAGSRSWPAGATSQTLCMRCSVWQVVVAMQAAASWQRAARGPPGHRPHASSQGR